MKTNYPQRNRVRRNSKSYKQVLIIVIVLVFGAGIFTFFEGALSQAFSPLWKGQNMATRGMTNAFSWFSSRDALVKENTAIRERMESQEAELMSLRAVKARESTLLEILGRSEGQGGILAAVMVRPPETPYDILVIDIGEKHGVKVGDTVIMPEGPSLGTIIEVSAKTSKVKLYSSDGERTNAVLERHNVPIILMGHGGGGFRITLPREIAVEEGDRIISADVSSELLAVVGKVNMAPTDSFKDIVAVGPANIFNLRFVVVKP